MGPLLINIYMVVRRMKSDYIVYEQPLSEHIRVCLRLEQLFQKIDHLQQDINRWKIQVLMTALIDILTILDRSDLKSKLIKSLTKSSNKLSPLLGVPNVDQNQLETLLSRLEQLLNYTINTSGKLGQSLRDNALLNDIKQHHSALGGPTSMDTPAYYFWLQRPLGDCKADIATWMESLAPTKQITETILELTRNSKNPTNKVAEKGFFHQVLNPKDDNLLVRVALHKSIEAFPIVSVGPHRVNVRLHTPKTHDKGSIIEADIPFELTCCN